MHSTKSQHSRSWNEKLNNNWHGPYRVREVPKNSTFYVLEELDGTQLAVLVAGNWVKKFFSLTSLDEARARINMEGYDIE